MNENAVENVTDDPDVLQPVPVKLDPVQVGAPEFGVCSRWLGVTNGQAVQILPLAPKRSAATIRCTAATGGAKAIVGSLGQVGNGAAGSALQGFQLGAGESLAYDAQAALYVVCDTAGQTVDISVLDERYR